MIVIAIETPFCKVWGFVFFTTFKPVICNSTHLGDYDHCEPVEIELLAGEIVVKNLVTRWQCTFESGMTIGYLSAGKYITEYDETTYTFNVI